MKTSKLIITSILCLLFLSCSYDSESDLIDVPDNPGSGGPNATVNYNDDIRPIMGSCIGCHSSPPVNGAPFALNTFSRVSQRANAILNSMSRQSGTPGAMPPSGRLPQATIDIIQQWIDEGKPEN